MRQKYRITSATAARMRRALCAVVMLACPAIVRAQVVAPNAPAPAATTPDAPATNTFQGEYFTSDLNEVFRLRHIEGHGQGDVAAFTNFGFTKFVWGSGGVLMFDLGARVTNEAEGGFTAGAHRRHVYGDYILGAGLFYDLQEFSQGSVALELFSRNWSLRGNGYAIIGDDVEDDIDFVTTAATNIFFEENFIVADGLARDEFYEVAMNGLDVEVARNLGWRSGEAFAGGYYLQGDIGGDTVGAKGGVRGFLMPDLAVSVTVSHDDIFDTNVYGGFTWFVGAKGGLSRPIIDRKIIIPVERNEQVAVNKVRRLVPEDDTVVLNFEDDPIIVVHVDENAAGSANEGTFEDPFTALPPTQDADIVYVHADGVYSNQSYAMADNQRLLAEGGGNVHLVETDELEDIVLPDGNGGANRPIIQNTVGDAITLADDDEVSNFDIRNPTVNGIFGDGISDFDINRNVITGSGERGIFLNNVVGDFDEMGGLTESGEVSDNVVTLSQLANIEMVLAGDFAGEVTGNTADGSVTAEGIFIHGPFAYVGEVSGNTADGNATDGISIAVDEFLGDIDNNTATNNMADGLLLAFGIFNGEVTGNIASDNGDDGIDLSITGDGRSVFEISDNTTESNFTEGIDLLFSGTGISFVQVLDNNFAGNNGGVDREFLAANDDLPGNEPEVFIELDGNISTNVLTDPPFNYEFDNEDLFSEGEMTVEVGTNVGSVEDDEEVIYGDFPL